MGDYHAEIYRFERSNEKKTISRILKYIFTKKLHHNYKLKLCLSLFLGLYQFIMRRNDQNKPEVVEHDYFEGETSFNSM